MASNASESSPLLPSKPPAKPQRSVTFNPNVSTSSPSNAPPLRPSTHLPISPVGKKQNGGQPMLSALNSKLRRRNSQGAPLIPSSLAAPKIGPQRTTRNVQKLKLLPNPEQAEDEIDEESGRDVYAQLTRIKEPTARRDAARLGKADRERLPRVTAYCTASSYQMDGLMRYLKGKAKTKGAAPKLFDECVYTPYDYNLGKKAVEPDNSQGPEGLTGLPERRHSDSAVEIDGNTEQRRVDLIDLHNPNNDGTAGNAESSIQTESEDAIDSSRSRRDSIDFDTHVHTPEVFLFNYGTVVIWGMTLLQEQRFLREIAKFENEKLAKDDVQTEDFNFYYTHEYQARIYNDFISLRDKKNYMTKLAISHALAQSVKTSLYEDLVDNTIETTKDIPSQIATTGKVNLSRREINMQIGELFILRINIHLQGSVLDSPELMWAEPQLEPIYQAVRSYLEMDQRVSLLTERLDVIADLLAVLKDQLTVTHSELLEWVVIVLIAAEILVAAVNIVVDLYAGVD
ncbi:Sporulation protein RMD1 [Lasiodiplodia hormozganensis]|uniref:Sporulation protein RMD1 n=1 Tax=Lasiodiplodia hormozganensis TaxID=869390 RepID=A0AA39YZ22_9PEZI|nr:Sporulation protein RMD1 [Lasiodiplodia hormozganensis]